jgi:hypothetical protein
VQNSFVQEQTAVGRTFSFEQLLTAKLRLNTLLVDCWIHFWCYSFNDCPSVVFGLR